MSPSEKRQTELRKQVFMTPITPSELNKSSEQHSEKRAKFVGTPRKATTHVNQNEDLIFEKSSPGKKAYRLAQLDVPAVDAAALLGDTGRKVWGILRRL